MGIFPLRSIDKFIGLWSTFERDACLADDELTERKRGESADGFPSSGEGEGLALFARVARGDEGAFHELFTQYSRVLCEVAFAYVHDREVAQELVQDVFCRVWEQRDRLVIRENVRVYLYSAVRHRALDHLKHERIAHRTEETSFTTGDYPAMSVPPPRQDEGLIEQERREIIGQAIADLPERQRRVFELRWYHHLSYAEIADVLGMTVRGVESARARAIESLQMRLQRVLGWEPS